MTDEQKVADRNREFTLEELERIIPDKHQRESFLHLIQHLDSDSAGMVALKGHLVIEEKITTAIEKFVFHPRYLDDARLTFAQKLAISRCLSLDEDGNSMWELVAGLNRLRNVLSHSLEGTSRANAMNALRAAYVKERDGKLEDWEKADDALLLLGVVSLCLGFLDSFEQEVERFRECANHLDIVVNPHRHVKLPTNESNPPNCKLLS
jgi:hypothetical protein